MGGRKDMENRDGIYEAIKVSNGKCIYCVKYVQGENKLFLYMHNGEIYFESNEYGFSNYPTFNVNNESHRLAKEIFTQQLKVDIRRKVLELKQLESILAEMGLQGIIDDDLEKGGILLRAKKFLLGEWKEQ